MSRPHPLHWLSERAGTGIREMPSNTAWVLSRALRPAGGHSSPAAGARDKARSLKASVMDAAPVGDSVETRMNRARAAADRARRAEEQALEAAQESKRCSAHAAAVVEQGRSRLLEAEQEMVREIEERVERERAAAQQDADEELQRRRQEADEAAEAARRDAEAAQEHAKELLAEASERLAEARRLADEATEAARNAAEEAQREAEQLTQDAEAQAREADERLAGAEEVGRAAVATAQRRAPARSRAAVRAQAHAQDGNGSEE